MSLEYYSLTESLEFSESESLSCDPNISSSSFDLESAYLITKVYNEYKKQKDNIETFIANTPIIAKIVNVEFCPFRQKTRFKKAHALDVVSETQMGSASERRIQKCNPYIYHIQFEHGPFNWMIYRRYNEFLTLHEHIALRIAAMKLPIPTKRASAIRQSFNEEVKLQSIKIGRTRRTLPPFPKGLEIFVPESEIECRKNQLEAYLQAVLNYKVLRISSELHKFCEISSISFIYSLGVKRKEGIVKKRCGGRLVFTGCLDFINNFTYRWVNRWLFVKDTFVAYINLADSQIGDVLLMDNKFKMIYGENDTGNSNGLIISNKTRRLFCMCQTSFLMAEWVNCITKVMQTSGKDFIQLNKHNSFAPLRLETFCRWYIDGDRYMNAISNAMELAKEEIYIADWWLSPQIHLKRPAIDDYWRLDNILLRKARQGVLIFVLLFKEIKMALNINSYYTKRILSKLHPNIQVLRHPDHIRRRTLLWSHHEKIVVIDQKICFLGGIDLCYGRWDMKSHPIHDVSMIGPPRESVILDHDLDLLVDNKRMLYETIHVANLKSGLKQSFFNRSTYIFASIKRRSTMLKPSKKEFYNNNCMKDKKEMKHFLLPYSVEYNSKNISLIRYQLKNISMKKIGKSKYVNSIRRKHINMNNSINSINSIPDEQIYKNSLYLGKDYVNWIVKDCVDLDKPDVDLIDRNSIPRMPWHDIGCETFGRAARDAARHFIQRWNAVKQDKASKKVKFNILVPKSYDHSEINKITVMNSHLSTCQVLRSVCEWSANIDSTENSILNAYIETIRKAKHYIYIENQFFISATSYESSFVKNQIGKEILKKIIYFHRKSKIFKVYILLPLLPGFESEINANSGGSLYAVLNYNYKSLFRGDNSLFGKLKKLQINPLQYIFLGSLRNFGFIGDKLSTELIYIHSKLLIVDDLYSIIGSSNLNDRSMLGNRDSEVAILFKDEQMKKVKFNNCEVIVGMFSSSLRKALMAEHLGVVEDETHLKNTFFFDTNLLNDPVQDSFFLTIWCSTARKNTELFDEVFSCIPSDNFKDFSSFNAVKKRALLRNDIALAKKKVLEIRGHLVLYPTEFLINENLDPSLVTRERYMPADTWV